MPYVKISDPNIIDLAAWHQVINVINQHSDSIAALTNNFGLAWSPDYDGDDWSSAFDFGSQQIMFGKIKMDLSKGDVTLTEIEVEPAVDSWVMLETGIPFSQQFSSKPVITATLITNNDGRLDGVVTVSDITTSDFNIRVSNLPAGAQNVYVNWIAIGPK